MPTALALRAHGGAVDAGIRSGQHLREDYQYHIVNAAMSHRVDFYGRRGPALLTPDAAARCLGAALAQHNDELRWCCARPARSWGPPAPSTGPALVRGRPSLRQTWAAGEISAWASPWEARATPRVHHVDPFRRHNVTIAHLATTLASGSSGGRSARSPTTAAAGENYYSDGWIDGVVHPALRTETQGPGDALAAPGSGQYGVVDTDHYRRVDSLGATRTTATFRTRGQPRNGEAVRSHHVDLSPKIVGGAQGPAIGLPWAEGGWPEEPRGSNDLADRQHRLVSDGTAHREDCPRWDVCAALTVHARFRHRLAQAARHQGADVSSRTDLLNRLPGRTSPSSMQTQQITRTGTMPGAGAAGRAAPDEEVCELQQPGVDPDRATFMRLGHEVYQGPVADTRDCLLAPCRHLIENYRYQRAHFPRGFRTPPWRPARTPATGPWRCCSTAKAGLRTLPCSDARATSRRSRATRWCSGWAAAAEPWWLRSGLGVALLRCPG